MRKYQYQIVRYIHDRVTSEFVNVGIVVFQPETKYLSCKFLTKYGRISQFFNEINGHFIISTLRQIEKEINRISRTTNELFFNFSQISEITNSIMPKDDSAIEFTEILYGIDIKPEIALNDLYKRLVNKYLIEQDKEIFDDKYVWKNIYKNYFDKYGITKNLKQHSVKTLHDTLEFDKAWKNGIWHCYQTLSFDLKKEDSIKNKVYKWSGIINELENSNENLHLYILTNSPKRHKTVEKFIEETLSNRSKKSVSVSVVYENQAEKFAKEISEEIEMHNS